MGHVTQGGHGASVHVRGALRAGKREVTTRARQEPLPLPAGEAHGMPLRLPEPRSSSVKWGHAPFSSGCSNDKL